MNESSQRRFPAFSSWLMVLLACLAMTPAGEARSSRSSDEGPQGGGELLVANEGIGTLPTWWVEDDAILPFTFLGTLFESYGSQVSFQAYVPEDEVQDLFQDATGSGFALLNRTGGYVGTAELIRVRIYGQITAVLDLATASGAGVSTVAKLGSAFSNGWVQWATSASSSSLMPVATVGSAVALDLQTPNGLALIQAGTLSLVCFAPNGDTAGATAKLVGSSVVYTQKL